jgi:hypothetical protein
MTKTELEIGKVKISLHIGYNSFRYLPLSQLVNIQF